MAKTLRQVRVDWTGIAGGPYISLFNFEYVAGQANGARDGVTAFLNGIKARYSSTLTAVCRADQAILDEQSGQIEDVEASGAPLGVVGLDTDPILPPATQGLLRLRTGAFVRGRRIQGRLFIPGATELMSTGVPFPAYMSDITAAATTLITSSPTFGVWSVFSRPLYAPLPEGSPPGTPRTRLRDGTHGEIVSASVWSKWGVQRKRRD